MQTPSLWRRVFDMWPYVFLVVSLSGLAYIFIFGNYH
jgi:hypothetical protein